MKSKIMKEYRSKEINEQVEYGLEKIENDQSVNIKLRDLLYIYKTVEEFRRFFHQRNHYPILNDVHTYLGNIETGGYSILNNLYIKILDKYLPKEITRKINEGEFTNPQYPYYYHLKKEEKIKVGAAGNVDPASYKLVQEMGYDIFKENENWIASDYNSEFIANSPLELLGLITLYRTKGGSWKVSDKVIEEFINLDAN